MVITDLKQQKRNQARYSVYIDDRYAFSLTDLDLSTSGLRIGHNLSQAELNEWQNQAEQTKTYQLALRYLSYRPRSGREILDYLGRKGVESEPAAIVLQRLQDQGLINDAAFARSWISYRQSLRPRSRRQLQQELQHKGLAREVIDEALGELGDDDQLSMLTELIEKKRRLTQYQEPAKLMAYLARQGFSYDHIKKALMRLDD